MPHDEMIGLILMVKEWAIQNGKMDDQLEEDFQFVEDEYGPIFGEGTKGKFKKMGWKMGKGVRTVKYYIDYLKVAYQEKKDLENNE